MPQIITPTNALAILTILQDELFDITILDEKQTNEVQKLKRIIDKLHESLKISDAQTTATNLHFIAELVRNIATFFLQINPPLMWGRLEKIISRLHSAHLLEAILHTLQRGMINPSELRAMLKLHADLKLTIALSGDTIAFLINAVERYIKGFVAGTIENADIYYIKKTIIENPDLHSYIDEHFANFKLHTVDGNITTVALLIQEQAANLQPAAFLWNNVRNCIFVWEKSLEKAKTLQTNNLRYDHVDYLFDECCKVMDAYIFVKKVPASEQLFELNIKFLIRYFDISHALGIKRIRYLSAIPEYESLFILNIAKVAHEVFILDPKQVNLIYLFIHQFNFCLSNTQVVQQKDINNSIKIWIKAIIEAIAVLNDQSKANSAALAYTEALDLAIKSIPVYLEIIGDANPIIKNDSTLLHLLGGVNYCSQSIKDLIQYLIGKKVNLYVTDGTGMTVLDKILENTITTQAKNLVLASNLLNINELEKILLQQADAQNFYNVQFMLMLLFDKIDWNNHALLYVDNNDETKSLWSHTGVCHIQNAATIGDALLLSAATLEDILCSIAEYSSQSILFIICSCLITRNATKTPKNIMEFLAQHPVLCQQLCHDNFTDPKLPSVATIMLSKFSAAPGIIKHLCFKDNIVLNAAIENKNVYFILFICKHILHKLDARQKELLATTTLSFREQNVDLQELINFLAAKPKKPMVHNAIFGPSFEHKLLERLQLSHVSIEDVAQDLTSELGYNNLNVIRI